MEDTSLYFSFFPGGSLRLPAFFNGLFGHKPSPFLVSNDGHVPEADTECMKDYFVIGPLCRYADDLVPMLIAMAGPNAYELGLDEKVDLSNLRVYTVHESHFPLLTSSPLNPELMERQRQVCNFLERRFSASVEDAGIKSFQYSPLICLGMLFCSNVRVSTVLQQNGNEKERIFPLLEILKYFFGYSKYHWSTMTALGLEHLCDSYPEYFSEYNAKGAEMGKEIQNLLGSDGILLFPSYPYTAPPHHRSSLAPFNVSFCSIFNFMYLPVTQCPLGLDRKGLPLGIQIVAGRNNDKLSLSVAKQLEVEFGGWRDWYPGKMSAKKL